MIGYQVYKKVDGQKYWLTGYKKALPMWSILRGDAKLHSREVTAKEIAFAHRGKYIAAGLDIPK